MTADGTLPPPPAPPAPPPGGNRVPIAIEEEMKSAFMDYAMSVIVSRALPDARDGLKPVHRRILFTQQQMSNFWNRPYIKCARVVGDVLGKFHPHGDTAAYDALVRLAQDFAMRYTLVDGQGNFGSIDGDPAAAYRYTECRMEKIGGELLADINKETVDFQPNYDDKETEPTVLPARFPNLLVNGASGIAVGMATNIPPHNLREVIDATIALINKPDITTDELIEIVPGPDFPTGGIICGRNGIRAAYEGGRGAILMRGRTTVEEHPKTGRKSLVATEIPYQVNKAKLIEKIAELVRDKRIEGIADIRDESDRDGMRIVVDLKRDAVPEIVQNNLWKMTPLQESFGINMLAIVEGRPQLLSLKQALTHYIAHRREVVTRRTLFELREARDRMHILEGLKIAVDNIDAVIDLIRSSKDTETAKMGLMSSFDLSPRQAQAILDMRLAKLTGLERDALIAEIKQVGELIAGLEKILSTEQDLMSVVVGELEEVKKEYSDARRTELTEADADIDVEDMIAPEEMVVTVTHGGYVKRNPKTLYKAQRRGGRGITGAATHEEDFVAQLFVASTHDVLLMLTNKGRAYSKKVWEVPQAGRTAKGKAFVNLLPLQEGERVVALLPVREFSEGAFVVMATRLGQIKKTSLDAFANIRTSGIIALTIAEDDDLVAVRITEGASDLLLGTRNGWAIRFREENVRPMGRTARGVRGVRLRDGESDQVVGMAVIPREEPATLLTVCERGYGKRTPTSDYPTKNRGGKGVITIKTTERNGKVVSLRLVTNEDDLMLITDGGKLIRMPVDGIPTIGRNTQGVRLIRLEEAEKVVAMERIAEKEEGEQEVAPEVAAARAELQAEPLAAEDLGDEAEAEENEADGEADSEGESGPDDGGTET
jgi:DNA gyrase subunit A